MRMAYVERTESVSLNDQMTCTEFKVPKKTIYCIFYRKISSFLAVMTRFLPESARTLNNISKLALTLRACFGIFRNQQEKK